MAGGGRGGLGGGAAFNRMADRVKEMVAAPMIDPNNKEGVAIGVAYFSRVMSQDTAKAVVAAREQRLKAELARFMMNVTGQRPSGPVWMTRV